MSINTKSTSAASTASAAISTRVVKAEPEIRDESKDNLVGSGTEEVQSRRPSSYSNERPGTRRKVVNQERVKEYLDMIDAAPLDIPHFVREHFRGMDEGYELRWVRHLDSKFGEFDAGNMAKRQRQGWEFVKPSELPEEFALAFRENVDKRSKQSIVTVDEMVLMKLPLEDIEAFREAQHQKTLRVSQGILDELNNKRLRNNFYNPNV
jgi:hypothetical protein